MPILTKRISKTQGLAPGTLVHVGDKKISKAKVSVIDYTATAFQEKGLRDAEACFSFKETDTVTWINVDGLHNVELIEKIGTCFGVHPLVLEDILNTGQRSKYEDFDHYIFIVLKMLSYDERTRGIDVEQISLLLGKNYVISFQEKEGDVFHYVRDRIRSGKGRVRSTGPDYLTYSLIDAIVDSYFVVLEKMGEQIEALEEQLLKNPTPQTLQEINTLKSNAIVLRKAVWPLREVISGLERLETTLITKTTHVFLRDVYDHTIQVLDTIESFRDMLSGKLDIYLSSVSNRMNEVMKTLTVIATIFIPLTFIAGIYGMNFINMPELSWEYGYRTVWVVMIAVSLLMVAYFKRHRWF